MKILTDTRIVYKLPAAIVLTVALVVVAFSTAAYLQSSDQLMHEAEVRLEAVAHDEEKIISEFLGAVARDLDVHSSSYSTIEAITAFGQGFAGFANPVQDLKAAYRDGDKSGGHTTTHPESGGINPYERAHNTFHPEFYHLQEVMGYEDIYLSDVHGNLIYSVSKRSDLGLNIGAPELQSTNLAEVIRIAMTLEYGAESAFVDMENYRHAGNRPAAFLARPVFDENGKRIGVLTYQLPIKKLSKSISSVTGLGKSGDVYLVGGDNLLRTNSRRSEEQNILKTRIENSAFDRAVAGNSGVSEIEDRFGSQALAFSAPVDVFGIQWVIIAKEDMSELLEPVHQMRTSFILIGAVILLIAALIAVLGSRTLAVPLRRIGESMSAVARRNYDAEVPFAERGDEIGHIARDLEQLRHTLIEGEATRVEAMYKSVAFEAASVPMTMVDNDYKIIYINQALVDAIGEHQEDFEPLMGSMKPEELVGQNIDRFHKVPSHVRDILNAPGALPMTTTIGVGKTYFKLKLVEVQNDDGDRSGIVVEWTDLTATHRDQSIIIALDNNSARIEITEDGKIGWGNEFINRISGQKPQDLEGLNADKMIQYLPSGDAKAQTMLQMIAARETITGDFRLTLGGSEFIFDATLSPVTNPKGEKSGMLLVGNDVTQERRALRDAEAERVRRQAEQNKVVEGLRGGLMQLSNGDLTAMIEEEFAPDYEQLRMDFNLATEKLHNAITNISESASSIRADTSNISSAAQSLSQRAETQAATLEETAAALDQLTTSVRAAADDATNAATMVHETRENVQTSGGVVHQAVGAMGEIEKFSTEISSISSVIDEIAFQTNLLALNAGVEAARAGEAGRGFAVVASEVRALAQRSSDAAREINSLISSSGAQIKKGVTLVSEAGEVLNKMMESVANIADSVESIAQGSTDQARGLQEINSAVNQLDQVTQHNAAMFEQTTAASLALAGETESLTENMTQFRVDGSATGSDEDRPLRVVHGE